MKKVLISIFSVCLALGLTVGCGSQSTNAPADNSSKASSDTQDEVLSKIKQTKTLTVGTDATFPPFEFKNDKKEYDGFDIDLIGAVGKELGADQVKFVDTEFKGLIPGLQGKKFDMIVSAMYITDERKKTIDFSDTYYPGGLCVVVKKDNNAIHGIDDLKGKKVSVQMGTKSAKFLQEKHPEVQLVQVETNVDMFMQLESGRADAVVTGKPAAKVYEKTHGTVKVLDQTLTEELYGYGIRKEDPQLTKAVNQALKTLKGNGKYNEIVQKWFGK
jgi:polar amino acid transport system substrate-binding protein